MASGILNGSSSQERLIVHSPKTVYKERSPQYSDVLQAQKVL